MKFIALVALSFFTCLQAAQAQTYSFKPLMVSDTASINDLSDVNSAGVATNDILAWNGSAWVVSQTTVASNLWAASGSNVYREGGNVGIGTTSPGYYKLTVNGGPSYAIVGTPTSASHGGVLGYSANTTYYGILGHANAYSFHGNGALYTYNTNASHAAIYGYHAGAHYGGRFQSAGSHALYARSTGGNGYAGYFEANSGSSSVAVYGRQNWTNGHAGLFHNISWNVYCYIGHGSNYSIICSGPTSGVSDERLKTKIEPLKEEEGLEALLAIRPVHYHWKDVEGTKKGEKPEMGFIAQDVEKVLPELVGETKLSDDVRKEGQPEIIKSLSYERLAAPIVKAIQQLKRENDSLKQENDLIKGQLQTIQQKLQQAGL